MTADPRAVTLFIAYLVCLVLLFVPPRTPPGASPVLAQDVSPSHYEQQASTDYGPPPYPDDPAEWDVEVARRSGCLETVGAHCPISRSAVNEQGIGE